MIEEYDCPVCLGDLSWGYVCKDCGRDFHFQVFEDWVNATGE